MKFKYILSFAVTASLSCAATFILSDNLSNTGSGAIEPSVSDQSGNYISGGSPLVEGTGLYNQNNSGASGDPSNYNAIGVGGGYSGNDDWRAVMTFDLGGLPAAPTGFIYDVTDVALVLEVSGGSTDGRTPTTINYYEGAFATGSLPVASASTFFNVPNNTFVSTSLGATSLDLNTDSQFFITLDADSGFYTFGSGIAGNNIGFSGTSNIDKVPELRITFDLIPIPEPTSITLISLGLFGLITRRKR